MGHRRLVNTSQMFEGENEQGWNNVHPELSYSNPVRTVAAENTSFFGPMENPSVDSMQFSSHWNPLSRSSGFQVQNVEAPRYELNASGPSHDLFPHLSASGGSSAPPENYAHQPSSSSYDWHNFDGVESGFVDLTMGSGRGHNKRKSPGIPSGCERDGSSRYFSAGSSCDFPLSSEFRQEKPSLDSQQLHWDRFGMSQSYRGNGLSIRNEAMRNVRSRTVFDLESNLIRSHVASNPSQTSYQRSHPIEHSGSDDIPVQSSGSLTRDGGHFLMSPIQGRIQVPESSAFSYEAEHFMGGTAVANGPLDDGGLQPDFLSVRNSNGPQSFHCFSTQSVRSMRNNYPRRSCPTFRGSSSSSVRAGHGVHIDDGIQLPAENYSRYPRPLSVSWRNSDRSGRPRISSDRYRPMSDDAAFHDQFPPEDFLTADRAAFYGARSMFDQHRDMRLDIDSMTYEELLALGERIGSVSTGLSENLISKCLTETRRYSSDPNQDEGNCAICLEDYGDMHEIGKINACGHDYHPACIRRWLSKKNTCPICKASAVDGDVKGKQ